MAPACPFCGFTNGRHAEGWACDIQARRVARELEEGHAAGGRAFKGAPEEWRGAALGGLEVICRRQSRVTSDDVFALIGKHPGVDSRAMGPVMKAGVSNGWMVWDLEGPERGWARSSQVGCHGNDIRVYRSLLYGGVP